MQNNKKYMNKTTKMNKMNKTNKTNKTTKMNKTNETKNHYIVYIIRFHHSFKGGNIISDKETSESKKNKDIIIEKLKYLLDKKNITQNKYDSIIRQLNGISIITTSLTSILKNGKYIGNSLNKWFNEDEGEKDLNEQKIKIFLYPSKHINYKKGDSHPRSYSKDNKYGDFMVIIDSEKNANMGEYFKNSYNSVDDFLANILSGCSDMFCTQGDVKPKPYIYRSFTIKNNQLTFDTEKIKQDENKNI